MTLGVNWDANCCPRVRVGEATPLSDLVILNSQDMVVRVSPIIPGPKNPNKISLWACNRMNCHKNLASSPNTTKSLELEPGS